MHQFPVLRVTFEKEIKNYKTSVKQFILSIYKPPPATENNCLSNNMEQCVFPAPDVPDNIMAWGYPVSACWRTAS